MNNIRSLRLAIAIGICVAALPGTTSAQDRKPAAGPRIPAGNGTLYVGGWPNKLYALDEATEKTSRSIELKTGAPRTLALSADQRRMYTVTVPMQDVEIVDLVAGKSIDNFRLSEGNKRIIIRSMVPDPLDRFVILVTRPTEKKIDRWEVGTPQIVIYDLASHKVSRTIPWPNDQARDNITARISPDGKLVYFFGDEVIIYDTAEWKQVDKWELSAPPEGGLGALNIGAADTTFETPGFYSAMFTVRDPAQNRDLMGIARVNLVGKSVDFWTLGPARQVALALAPDRKRAYGLFQEIGRNELWTFDLENKKLAMRAEFDGLTRAALRVSTNGRILYVSQAGAHIDLYDSSNYKYLRTITTDADRTSGVMVVPAPASTRRR